VWGPSVVGYPKSAGTFKVTVTVSTVDSVPNLVAVRTFKMVIAASQISISSSSAVLSGKYLAVKLSCERTRAGVYEAAPGGHAPAGPRPAQRKRPCLRPLPIRSPTAKVAS